MIYTEKEKNSHIAELQKYIHCIALHNRRIPVVVPDGIYDGKTAEAVRMIQHEYRLPETGETDFATWETIVLAYRHCTEQGPEKPVVFPDTDNCTFCRSEHGHRIKILHIMLDALSEEYSDIPRAGAHEEYDDDTFHAICMLQKKSGLPETGETDKYTWNIIARLFNRLT